MNNDEAKNAMKILHESVFECAKLNGFGGILRFEVDGIDCNMTYDNEHGETQKIKGGLHERP